MRSGIKTGMVKYKPLFFLLLLLLIAAGVFTACRMDNKNNTDQGNVTNEDISKMGYDSAAPDHTKVENDTLPDH
jgi:hypothetical protein